jgi:hypothetical protein
MTMRLTISTRPARTAVLALLALLLGGGLTAASAQESRTDNAPPDRVFTVSRSVLKTDDRSVEKRILDDIGRSL